MVIVVILVGVAMVAGGVPRTDPPDPLLGLGAEELGLQHWGRLASHDYSGLEALHDTTMRREATADLMAPCGSTSLPNMEPTSRLWTVARRLPRGL